MVLLMQKAYLTPIALLGGMLYSLPSMGADRHARDRQQITDAYHKMQLAFEAKDVDGSVEPLTPGCVIIGADGKVLVHNKKEEREDYVQVFAHLADGTEITTVDKITFTRYGATAEGTDDGSGHLLVDGHTHIFSVHTTSLDLWIKCGNTWLLKRSRTLTQRTMADGHPVP